MPNLSKAERIDMLISRLSGSTNSMQTECEDLDLDDMDDEVTEAVDAAIFECTQCGWWCTIDEEASEDYGRDEWTCETCCKEDEG